ncbi:hypothetical protein ACFVWR_15900 [Leifsonia sp. NPDC058292]|uniref:hypothetical protein n=1 Tax=Leifsonia sp. NPDC058292 TaxID=3346428 RepID=UPI0036DF1C4E
MSHSADEVPRLLSGPSTWELTFIGLWPMLIGLGAGLVSIPLRYSQFSSVGAFVVLIVVGGSGLLIGLILLGLRNRKLKRELKAGYTTVDGHPESPRLDRKTEIVLRWPGEEEPTYREIVAKRELRGVNQ